MDIHRMGAQYLAEAERVYAHMIQLREQRKTGVQTNYYELDRRIQMFYDIYLEMKHTGQYLMRYPAGESSCPALSGTGNGAIPDKTALPF